MCFLLGPGEGRARWWAEGKVIKSREQLQCAALVSNCKTDPRLQVPGKESFEFCFCNCQRLQLVDLLLGKPPSLLLAEVPTSSRQDWQFWHSEGGKEAVTQWSMPAPGAELVFESSSENAGLRRRSPDLRERALVWKKFKALDSDELFLVPFLLHQVLNWVIWSLASGSSCVSEGLDTSTVTELSVDLNSISATLKSWKDISSLMAFCFSTHHKGPSSMLESSLLCTTFNALYHLSPSSSPTSLWPLSLPLLP